METKNNRRDLEGELNQLISFMVGGEEYGIEILRVKEIIRSSEITPLPKSPSFVKGIINLRGDVIPIIDLRDKFGLDAYQESDATRVIVVDVDGRLVGMVVDSASQVVRIASDQIDPPPPILGGISSEYLKGVAKLDDRLVILLNIDKILSTDEKIDLEQITGSVRAAAGTAPRTK